MPITPRLANDLRRALPPDSLVERESERGVFECDGLTLYRQTPGLVALPATRQQLINTVKICQQHQTPIVARGAGTGLSGGALPLADGVLLSLAKLNRITNIDPDAQTATVEPGVINAAISAAARPHRLYYAPDPSSQTACSIGGNIAENSGGVHCLKYGLTAHNIVALTVVTISGDVLHLAADSPGYDLAALLIGSEGMLAIVAEATVKLLPIPPAVATLLAAFPAIAPGARCVSAIIASGVIPAGLEMMDNAAIRAAEAFCGCGYPTDAGAILLCELDGSDDEVCRQTEQVTAIMRAHDATAIIPARDESHRAQLWKGRKSAFPAVGRLSPDYYCMDGTVPRRALADVLEEIYALADKYQLGVANVFHAGDGNLHPLIFFDAEDADSAAAAKRFGDDILIACVRAGGTVTGEHGIGVEKLDAACAQFSDAEIRQFNRLKAAFDPQTLLNPGKAIPTLARCSELGGMHIHRGQLPRPDLPRF